MMISSSSPRVWPQEINQAGLAGWSARPLPPRVKALLARGWRVFAGVLPGAPTDLKSGGNLTVVDQDVSKTESVRASAQAVTKALDGGGLDLLMNVAGVANIATGALGLLRRPDVSPEHRQEHPAEERGDPEYPGHAETGNDEEFNGDQDDPESDEGEVLPAGEIGTVYMRNLIGGDFEYHGAPEKTAAAHREPGVMTVGDVGYLDDEGYLFLCDRKIDMIISGGVNIYPAEIEAVLVNHPAVLDAAVFGIPHDEFGEEVKAVV